MKNNVGIFVKFIVIILMLNNMALTAEQRLRAISKIIESDMGFEADTYSLRKNKDKDAQLFADMIMEVYMIVHPHFGCKHNDWDDNTYKLSEEYE